jgi:enamine deaminase RidA (YjgF/YER057c/UK114 family)
MSESLSTIERRLRELELTLPEAATPAFDYQPVVIWRDVAYVSGQLPKVEGEVRLTGKLGESVSLEEAQDAARICVLQALAVLKEALGSLDRVARVLKVTGFVASAPSFVDQPKVIDAASTLLGQVLGKAGQHARSAVGVAVLPRDSPVEIEFVIALREDM